MNCLDSGAIGISLDFSATLAFEDSATQYGPIRGKKWSRIGPIRFIDGYPDNILTMAKKRTRGRVKVELPEADAKFIDWLVETGEFSKSTDAVRYIIKNYRDQWDRVYTGIKEGVLPSEAKVLVSPRGSARALARIED